MSLYHNPVTYCNIAIYCNTLKYNTQYSIDPYCFTPNMNYYELLIQGMIYKALIRTEFSSILQ